ncbi:MAG: winged helix-turn-helix domain-containing protein [Bacteroidales bacterium]|jgi:hypothetical protein|nr:winged helix-turn-helix domain-containing protein [Bacteroidales bacterium]
MSNEFKAGDRAYTKVGRNLVEVRVKAKTETGWTVTTRTGRTLAVRSLEAVPGAAAGIASAATPKAAAKAAKAAAKATPKAAPKTEAAAVPKKGLSLLNAAATVLERSGEAMPVRAMIEEAKASGLWTPTGGKTPEQTLYSAIIREIKDKGGASRFRKDGRGRFSFAR